MPTPTASDLRAMAARARAAATADFRGGEIDLGWTNLRVRPATGTYVARGAGILASCTAGADHAARAWAAKAEARAAELEACP